MHGLILRLNNPPLGNPWGESIHLCSGVEIGLKQPYPRDRGRGEGKGRHTGGQKPKWPELILVSCSMKHASKYYYSTLHGMLVHCRVTPQQYVAGTHLHT